MNCDNQSMPMSQEYIVLSAFKTIFPILNESRKIFSATMSIEIIQIDVWQPCATNEYMAGFKILFLANCKALYINVVVTMLFAWPQYKML